MQNSIFKISTSVLFLLILSLFAAGQQQSGLKISYDKFDGATTVYGSRVQLVDDVTRVSIQPVAVHTGEKFDNTGKSRFILLFSYIQMSGSQEEKRRFEGKEIILLVDGNERIAGNLHFHQSQKDGVHLEFYTYLLEIDLPKLKKIAEAKTVEIRWAGRIKDYSLNDSAIASAKEVFNYFSAQK